MRKILFCSLATLATLGIQARQLTPAEALTRAIGGEAVSYTSPSRGGDITLAYTCKDASTGNNGLYVFNRAAGDGFLVVSADDVVQPLLGYADVGEFETSDMPDNLRAWLEEYTAQIAWASTMTATPSRAAGEGRPSRASIKPMCVTMWNQDSPYNDLCPLYQGDRSVTGCVATAMAHEITFSGALQAGEVGKEYFMMLYNGNTQICEQQPRFTIGTLTGIEGVGCDSDISSVEIYNASGVKVAVGTDIDSAESLLSSTLPSGIYIMVYVHTDGHRTSQKFVKR